MALASGNVVYCPSIRKGSGGNNYLSIKNELEYKPVSLQHEVRLVDWYLDTTYAVTDYELVVINRNFVISDRYDLNSLTQHRPVQLMAFQSNTLFMLTSGGTIVYFNNTHQGEEMIDAISIAPDAGYLRPSASVLLRDGSVHKMTIGSAGLELTPRENGHLDVSSDMVRLAVSYNPIAWNELSVVELRGNREVKLNTQNDQSQVAKCIGRGVIAYILYSDGSLYSMISAVNGTRIMGDIDGSYADICAITLYTPHLGDCNSLIGVLHDGTVQIIRQESSLVLRGTVPRDVTVTSSDISV